MSDERKDMRFVELSELRKNDSLKVSDLVWIKSFEEFRKLAEEKPLNSSLIYLLGNFNSNSVENVVFGLVDKYSKKPFEKEQQKFREFIEKELDYVPADSKPGEIIDADNNDR